MSQDLNRPESPRKDSTAGKELIHIDNGEDYTLIPLDDETFQVFRTADLVLQQPPQRSKSPTRNASEVNESNYSSHYRPPNGNYIQYKAQPTPQSDAPVKRESDRPIKREPDEASTKKRKIKTEEDERDDAVVFACQTCDATFCNEFSLDAHIRQHLVWKEMPSDG